MARPKLHDPDTTTRVNVVLPKKLHDAIKGLGKNRGLTVSEIIRGAVTEIVIRELKEEIANNGLIEQGLAALSRRPNSAVQPRPGALGDGVGNQAPSAA